MKTRPSFSEAIAARGIDAAKEIANLKRRARYALNCDRPKVFATTPMDSIHSPWIYDRKGRRITNGTIEVDLQTLESARDGLITTPDYVAAWCRLNHLKP